MRQELKKVSDYVKGYYHITEQSEFKVKEIEAIYLFNSRRYDLAAKLYYIDSLVKGKSLELAKELYRKHIEAFQDGIVKEAGKPEKEGIEKYLQEFNTLIEIFKKDTFDQEREWIPVDKYGQLLDGSHRTACAIYFRKKLKIIQFCQVTGICFDYRFFKKRCLERSCLRMMAAMYPRFHYDIFVILFWPKALNSKKFKKVVKFLKEQPFDIVYAEKIKTDYEQFLNLIYHCYQNQNWLGNKQNNFQGVRRKANSCYTQEEQSFMIYIIRGIDQENMLKVKKQARMILNMGKRGMHSTDNQMESRELIDYIFQRKQIEKAQILKVTQIEKIKFTVLRRLRKYYTFSLIKIKKILKMQV